MRHQRHTVKTSIMKARSFAVSFPGDLNLKLVFKSLANDKMNLNPNNCEKNIYVIQEGTTGNLQAKVVIIAAVVMATTV